MPDSLEAQLKKLVREALALSDAMGRVDTSIELNDALVTLDGLGVGPSYDDDDYSSDGSSARRSPLLPGRTLRIIRP